MTCFHYTHVLHTYTIHNYLFIFKFTGNNCDSLLLSFSFIKSIQSFVEYNKNNELNIINGLKVIFMTFVLLAHRLMCFAAYPKNYRLFEDVSLENTYL